MLNVGAGLTRRHLFYRKVWLLPAGSLSPTHTHKHTHSFLVSYTIVSSLLNTYPDHFHSEQYCRCTITCGISKVWGRNSVFIISSNYIISTPGKESQQHQTMECIIYTSFIPSFSSQQQGTSLFMYHCFNKPYLAVELVGFSHVRKTKLGWHL